MALTYARIATVQTQPSSTFSSYDTGRNGYRALYELLRAERILADRFERPVGLLDHSVGTLILSSPSAAAPIDRNDLVALKQWVRSGGRVVVLDTEYGGPGDAVLGLPSTQRAPGSNTAQPIFAIPETYRVRTVRGAFDGSFPFAAAPKAIPLLATSRGIVALEFPLGRGQVVAITDPTIFSNSSLAQSDNARFAYNLLAGTNGAVAFDERIHGYVRDTSFWEALPQQVHWGIYLLGVAIGLGLIGANLRFAPAISLARPDERDSSAYISSMATLLARGRATRQALSDCAEAALRVARRRFGLSERTGFTVLLARIGRDALRDPLIELERLRNVSQPTERELLRAGRLSAQLRKELGVR
ncbi:MAG: DUF4350 domain-containing protein [Candidatus Baltobacteraceae bacterium]